MKKLTFICLIAFAALLSTSAANIYQKIMQPFMNGPKKDLFKVYHTIFKKDYDLNTEEGMKRYRAFKENLKYINEENSKNLGYKLGFTPFTDLTNEEYVSTYLSNPEQMQSKYNFENAQPKVDRKEKNIKRGYTPGSTNIDWSSVMSPVRDQGKCGSCWSFATQLAVEANYKIQTQRSIVASVQQMVDCSNTGGNFGCRGGNYPAAFNYLKINGVALESDYPYTSGPTNKANTCQYDRSKVLRIVSDFNSCNNCDIDTWISMLQNGPIAVYMSMSHRAVQNYVYGIMTISSCTTFNHAVVAVGIQNDGQSDYLIVQNSFGTNWGENGFFRIRISETMDGCYLLREAFQPIINTSAAYFNNSPFLQKRFPSS
jgi:C1A family cysteine protease